MGTGTDIAMDAESDAPELVKMYCDLTVRRPCGVCGGCCGCIWFLVIMAIVSAWPVMSEPGTDDWIVVDSAVSKNFDALADAENVVIGGQAIDINAIRKESYTFASVSFLYDFKTGADRDIFNPKSVQAMCKVERILLNHPMWPSYCELKSGVNITPLGPMTNECEKKNKNTIPGCTFTSENVPADCKDPILTTTFQFYGAVAAHNYTCELLPETTVKNKAKLMYDALDTPAGRLTYGFFMDKNTVTRSTRFTAKTRSTVFLGGPLPGFKHENDKLNAQLKEYGKILGNAANTQSGVEGQLFKYFDVSNKFGFSAYRNKFITPEGSNADKLDVRFYSFAFRQNEFDRVVSSDFLMVIFSLLFVYYWINRHTGSFFLASAGMFQIFFSLPAALFFYNTIFRITYFVEIHILAVFLVLGIGADDVFVMVDAWKQSIAVVNGPYSPPKRESGKTPMTPEQVGQYNRLLYAYNRTYQAVFNTSFTTAVAFFATGVSPCMPISSFGIYAAICIILNYIFAITLLPAVVLIWHRRYENKPHPIDMVQQVLCWCQCQRLCKKAVPKPKPTEPVGSTSVLEPELQEHEIPYVFRKLYVPCMSTRVGGSKNKLPVAADGSNGSRNEATEGGIKVVAIAVIILCLALFAQGAYFASKLAPPSKPEEFFPADHMFTRTEDDMNNGFFRGSEEQYTEMKLVWGIKGIDRSGYDKWKPDLNRGTVVFDTAFNIAPSVAQKAILEACALSRTWGCTAAGGCVDGMLARPHSTICFLEQYRTWHMAQYGEDTFTVGDSNAATFFERLQLFLAQPVLDHQGNPLLTGKFTSWQELVGFVNNKLTYVVVPFTSTMLTMQPLMVKKEVQKFIDSLLLKIKKDHTPAGFGLETLYHTADRYWVWSATEQGLIDGMFLGLSICFPVAYVVLIGATRNFYLASYAIFAIGCIVCTVLGFCQSIMQWPLGVGETIAGIIVIGFSVDYVVHLGHMVEEAAQRGMHSREQRFRYAAETMGPTVVAGAITTGGSALFMFACQMTFFYKMAVLICITIFMSFVFSLGFFMAMIYVVGPQNSSGRVPTICKKKDPTPPISLGKEGKGAPPISYNQHERALSPK